MYSFDNKCIGDLNDYNYKKIIEITHGMLEIRFRLAEIMFFAINKFIYRFAAY